MLTGEVAIQIVVKQEDGAADAEYRDAQPRRRQLGAHAGEEQRRREEDDAEHVVRGALDVAARPAAANTSACASSRSAVARASSSYSGIANGVGGASGLLRGLVATQASTAGLNSARNRWK